MQICAVSNNIFVTSRVNKNNKQPMKKTDYFR